MPHLVRFLSRVIRWLIDLASINADGPALADGWIAIGLWAMAAVAAEPIGSVALALAVAIAALLTWAIMTPRR